MSYQDLQRAFEIIEESGGGDFEGAKPETLASLAEDALGLRFPPTYRGFLLRSGCGDITGCEFYGLIDDEFEDSSVPNGVWLTLRERQDSGLPKTLVIVYSDGMGTYFAIDTAQSTSGDENPIVSWQPDADPEVVASPHSPVRISDGPTANTPRNRGDFSGCAGLRARSL